MQKFYISVQLFVLALISLNAWATHPHESQQKLVFCSEGSPDHFATSLRATTTSRNINNAIYETLVTHIRGETKLAPGLAEHWEISPDGKQYTFFLRRGVKWHSNRFFQPKRSFNADDVLFMLERMQDSSGHRSILGGQGSNLIGDLRSRYSGIYLNALKRSNEQKAGFN